MQQPDLVMDKAAIEAKKDWLQNRNLKQRYGITKGDYDRMFAEQEGVCGICEGPPIRTRSLSVDHCHATGKVRGLLCHSCNLGLGKFQDDPGLIEQALTYLRESNAP